jgi:diadenosine tetraphosphatase ApaH/serine/threonine PP2A family protein phosphatase
VLDQLAALRAECVLGNHDAWVIELANGASTHDFGTLGPILTRHLSEIGPARLEFMRSWPWRQHVAGVGHAPEALVIHGSPSDPFEYLESIASARVAFSAWEGPLALVGHTHVPGIHATLEGPGGNWVRFQAVRETGERVRFPPLARWIVNCGSVGQPRDEDPRASYALLDHESGSVEFERVEYDVERTQRDMRAAGTPEYFAARLAVGQ